MSRLTLPRFSLSLAHKSALAAACLLAAATTGAAEATPATVAPPPKAQASSASWWSHAVIYEIYVRSFQDSNGDGIGDLKGVTQRLDYLKGLGIDAIWLTPFYPSPNADFGYDVADYTDIAKEYGTLADWDELVREANKRGIRLLVDFVLNHTSDQHPWFQESRSSKTNPKRDWYIWRDGKPDGTPPNNWHSIFGGSTWDLDPATKQWYYHIFLPQQPDLNWANPEVRKAMYDVARFWLKRGAAGFRLDATGCMFEDPNYPDDPNIEPGPQRTLKPYNSGRAENHQVLKELRTVLDSFPGERVILAESVTADIESLAAAYGQHSDEIQLPMNFMIGDMNKLDSSAFKKQFDDANLKLGAGHTPVFFFSSHDHSRQWSLFGDGKHNDQIAKLTAALNLAQNGTVLMYYGEELGMGDMTAAELASATLGPKRPRADDRDRARSPMQWDASAGAGFSTGTPWLPVQAATQQYNVASAQQDPNSVYHWYLALNKLRHQDPVFREGSYLPLESGNKDVFAFARTTAKGDGAVVVLNVSANVQKVRIAGLPAKAAFGSLVLASPAVKNLAAAEFELAPYGVVINKFSVK